jgi:hypothetical protein
MARTFLRVRLKDSSRSCSKSKQLAKECIHLSDSMELRKAGRKITINMLVYSATEGLKYKRLKRKKKNKKTKIRRMIKMGTSSRLTLRVKRLSQWLLTIRLCLHRLRD